MYTNFLIDFVNGFLTADQAFIHRQWRTWSSLLQAGRSKGSFMYTPQYSPRKSFSLFRSRQSLLTRSVLRGDPATAHFCGSRPGGIHSLHDCPHAGCHAAAAAQAVLEEALC
jgi:hypothetical protein